MKHIKIFEDFLNESLRAKLKGFIKKHEDKLNKLADDDDWEKINLMLIDYFGVEADSKDAKELIDSFMLIF